MTVPEACAEPACRSKTDLLRVLRQGAKTPAAAPPAASPAEAECPPFREDLGRCSWTLLHSLAAHYPPSPSAYEQAHAAAFLRGLAALYPCTHCRDDFHAAVVAEPPRVESREALAVWVCRRHNEVNEKLGKPAFPCDFASLDTRWRKGKPGCFAQHEGETAAASLGQE